MEEALNVKAVSRLSGVSEYTLRAWEKRYQAVSPKRTDSGRRIYTLADVERLRLLLSLVNLGHSIGNIARLPNEALLKLKAQSVRAPAVAPVSAPISRPESESSNPSREQHQQVDAFLKRLKTMLDEYRTEELSRELSHARSNFSARVFLLRIVVPFFGWVGEQVASGKLSIAQEHVLSAILRDRLAEVYLTLEPYQGDDARRVLLTTPEGDLHEFGILISSILCTIWRLRTDYLGPNLPAEEVALAARELGSDIVILGALDLPQGTARLPLDQYVKKLDSLLPPQTFLWVGGSAVRLLKKLRPDREFQCIETIDKLEDVIQRMLG